jgi:hypothetical protein
MSKQTEALKAARFHLTGQGKFCTREEAIALIDAALSEEAQPEPVARVIAEDEAETVDVGFVDWIGRVALKSGTLLYAQPVQPAEWQPIETAPKDHFSVLTWSREYGRRVAFRDVTWDWYWSPTSRLPAPPTHWMPLPASPIGASKDGT